jgi:hypothetical protein
MWCVLLLTLSFPSAPSSSSSLSTHIPLASHIAQIIIQGNLLKEATKFLLTKYKIPKKYFEEQDKTKKSKK